MVTSLLRRSFRQVSALARKSGKTGTGKDETLGTGDEACTFVAP